MKKTLGFLMVAASLVLASSAPAQQMHVKAEIPFNFVIGQRVYPAGNYDIQNAAAQTLIVDNGSEKGRTMVMPFVCRSNQWAERTVLIFHRVMGSYHLYRIWVQGNTIGREFALPKEETLLARQGTKSEEVTVAATLIH